MTEIVNNDQQYISIEDASQFIQELDLDLKVRVSALNLAIAFSGSENPGTVDDVIEIAGKFENYLVAGIEEKNLPIQDDTP